MKDSKLILIRLTGKDVVPSCMSILLNDGSGRSPLQPSAEPLLGTRARASATKPVVSLAARLYIFVGTWFHVGLC